ncbi:M48 family metallopeptidase [Crenobacter caeni]
MKDSVGGRRAATWGVKRMKTKWGSCNPQTSSFWFNLELVKQPPACIECIVVHDLMHLVKRHHNDHFTTLLDQHLPNWRSLQLLLNQSVLVHERRGGELVFI